MVIDTKIIIHIKTDAKGENVDFTYKRKDLKPLEDNNAKLLVMYAEQIVRFMIESGMVAPKAKDVKDGEPVAK